eukprot:g17820.t1
MEKKKDAGCVSRQRQMEKEDFFARKISRDDWEQLQKPENTSLRERWISGEMKCQKGIDEAKLYGQYAESDFLHEPCVPTDRPCREVLDPAGATHGQLAVGYEDELKPIFVEVSLLRLMLSHIAEVRRWTSTLHPATSFAAVLRDPSAEKDSEWGEMGKCWMSRAKHIRWGSSFAEPTVLDKYKQHIQLLPTWSGDDVTVLILAIISALTEVAPGDDDYCTARARAVADAVEVVRVFRDIWPTGILPSHSLLVGDCNSGRGLHGEHAKDTKGTGKIAENQLAYDLAASWRDSGWFHAMRKNDGYRTMEFSEAVVAVATGRIAEAELPGVLDKEAFALLLAIILRGAIFHVPILSTADTQANAQSKVDCFGHLVGAEAGKEIMRHIFDCTALRYVGRTSAVLPSSELVVIGCDFFEDNAYPLRAGPHGDRLKDAIGAVKGGSATTEQTEHVMLEQRRQCGSAGRDSAAAGAKSFLEQDTTIGGDNSGTEFLRQCRRDMYWLQYSLRRDGHGWCAVAACELAVMPSSTREVLDQEGALYLNPDGAAPLPCKTEVLYKRRAEEARVDYSPASRAMWEYCLPLVVDEMVRAVELLTADRSYRRAYYDEKSGVPVSMLFKTNLRSAEDGRLKGLRLDMELPSETLRWRWLAMVELMKMPGNENGLGGARDTMRMCATVCCCILYPRQRIETIMRRMLVEGEQSPSLIPDGWWLCPEWACQAMGSESLELGVYFPLLKIKGDLCVEEWQMFKESLSGRSEIEDEEVVAAPLEVQALEEGLDEENGRGGKKPVNTVRDYGLLRARVPDGTGLIEERWLHNTRAAIDGTRLFPRCVEGVSVPMDACNRCITIAARLADACMKEMQELQEKIDVRWNGVSNILGFLELFPFIGFNPFVGGSRLATAGGQWMSWKLKGCGHLFWRYLVLMEKIQGRSRK